VLNNQPHQKISEATRQLLIKEHPMTITTSGSGYCGMASDRTMSGFRGQPWQHPVIGLP